MPWPFSQTMPNGPVLSLFFWMQVKELGVAVYNCSCLAKDLAKMFEVYWALGLPNASIPSPWPADYTTTYNKESPLELKLNETSAGVYLSVSQRVQQHSLILHLAKKLARFAGERPWVQVTVV